MHDVEASYMQTLSRSGQLPNLFSRGNTLTPAELAGKQSLDAVNTLVNANPCAPRPFRVSAVYPLATGGTILVSPSGFFRVVKADDVPIDQDQCVSAE